MARSYVSWKTCTTSRKSYAPPLVADKQTRSSRRRKRLHVGALRFQRDVCQRLKRRGRVLLFALTMTDREAEQAERSMLRLFQNYRNRWPGREYFWWAEFQKRGALHYHGMLVNPPFEFERDARRYFDSHWPHAEIQTWVQFKSGGWFQDSAGSYALKDIRKVAGKWYEQDYDRMPLHWKTFASSALEFSAAEHRPHENELLAGYNVRTGEVLIEEVRLHIPAIGGCVLRHRRVIARPGLRERLRCKSPPVAAG